MNIKLNDLEELKAARAEKRLRDLRLLSFHHKIYQLLMTSDQAEELRKAAHERIDLWRSKRLCSIDYINAWESMIDHLDDFKERALDEFSDNGVALRQNTPFSAFMRKLK